MKNELFDQDWDEVTEPLDVQKPPRRLRDYRVSFWHQFVLLIMSSLLSLSSFFPLFFRSLATGLQSQQAYISWALMEGQLPYVDTYSKAGLLYHGLSTLAQQLGGYHWLIVGQVVAFYLSGLYIYQLIQWFTGQKAWGFRAAGLFYLFNLTFGFGGFYPMQLATPFVLIGLWLLVTYVADCRRDEVFIGYGMTVAVAIGIEPLTLVFWLIAFLVLAGVNIKRRRWARGFYQQLAAGFGLMLVGYPLAYLALNLQLALPYLTQTVLGNATFGWSQATEAYLAMGGQLLALVATGLLTGLFALPFYAKKMAEHVASLVLLSLTTIVYTVFAILQQSSQLYHGLVVLPFGLLLTIMALAGAQPATAAVSRRRHHQVVRSYQRSHAYLPLLALLASLGWVAYGYVSQQPLQAERELIAQSIVEHSSSSETIVAWDDSASIYQLSQRLSATQFPVVTVNTAPSSHQSLLVDEVLQGRAKLVVVNRGLTLPDQVQTKLEKDYEVLEEDAFEHFILYQEK